MPRPRSAQDWPMPPGKRMRYHNKRLQIQLGPGQSGLELSRAELAMFGVDVGLIAAFVRAPIKGRMALALPLIFEVKRQLLMLTLTAAFAGAGRYERKHGSPEERFMQELAAMNGLTMDELHLRVREHRLDGLIKPTLPTAEPGWHQRMTAWVIPTLIRVAIWPVRMPRTGLRAAAW